MTPGLSLDISPIMKELTIVIGTIFCSEVLNLGLWLFPVMLCDHVTVIISACCDEQMCSVCVSNPSHQCN